MDSWLLKLGLCPSVLLILSVVGFLFFCEISLYIFLKVRFAPGQNPHPH